MAESVVLEETIDESYEPTEEEIEEYAKWLGIDLENDTHLFWVAKQGLKAPLPPEWKPCQSPDGELYYFNFENGESVWDHPCDDYYRNMYKVGPQAFGRAHTPRD
jgi:centrosomal protein CEP164